MVAFASWLAMGKEKDPLHPPDEVDLSRRLAVELGEVDGCGEGKRGIAT